jgi:hypothetical protein
MRGDNEQINGKAILIMIELCRDLFDFMKVRKKFWLLPIVLVLLLLGTLLVVSEGSAVAPLIYTLF